MDWLDGGVPFELEDASGFAFVVWMVDPSDPSFTVLPWWTIPIGVGAVALAFAAVIFIPFTNSSNSCLFSFLIFLASLLPLHTD